MDGKELGNTYFHAMPDSVRHDYESGGGVHGSVGITLRQHFAGLAMAGALGGAPGNHLVPDQLARESLAHADALLRELAKET